MKPHQKRILVLKGQGLSQFVEAEPSFAAIRDAHPNDTVDLLTTHNLGRLAKGAPYFDRVFAGEFQDNSAKKTFLGQLKRMHYARVYDLDGTPLSFDIRRTLTGFRGAEWIGPKRMINARTKKPMMTPTFSAPAMRKILQENGIAVDGRLPSLSWALQGRKDAANMKPSWFGITGPYVLLIPAADERRRWPAQHYARLAFDLIARNITPVIVGGADLKEFGHEISQDLVRLEPSGARTIVDLTDKTDLAQLAALAKDAAFFIGGVAEEIHLTSSLGCPGLLILHPSQNAGMDALYGREIVRLTANNLKSIEPEAAFEMLESMGLIDQSAPVEETRKKLLFN